MLENERKKLIKSEVAHLFNTSKETLRHYEKKGLLKPEINDANYRLYDVEEMKRLRQIFWLRDLGLSLGEQESILNTPITKEKYIEILEEQNGYLTEKIKHLIEKQQLVDQLLFLLDTDTQKVSFQLKQLPSRQFYSFNPFIVDIEESIKDFYDAFKDLIENDLYSERVLYSQYDYRQLENFELKQSNVCIEFDDPDLGLERKIEGVQVLQLEAGLYLSVFFIFRLGDFETLSHLKDEIDTYVAQEELKIVDFTVIETEHPELSVTLEEGVSIYEMQLKVIC